MISMTKEKIEELDYLKRELEFTGYNIKVLTTEIKRVEYELSRHMERITDNSNVFCSLVELFLYCYLKWKDIWHYMKE